MSAESRRAVVFDLGGVVFHWQPAQLLRETLPARAVDAGAAEALAAAVFQGFTRDSDWAAFDLGRVDADSLAARIARRTGLAAAEVRAVIDAVPLHLKPDPATVALIERLADADLRVAFLSNMPASYAEHLQRLNPFFARFDGGVFSSQVGLMKPDAAFYARAESLLGLDAAAVVFIDDVQANVDAARAVGWDAFVYRDGTQCARELAARGLTPRLE